MTIGLVVLGGATGFGIAWAQRAMASLRLQVLEGPGRGSEFILGRNTFIGSDRGCPVRLTGAGVAARHARIVHRGRDSWLEDLGSPLGVVVNDRKLSGAPAPLKHGDLVRIGENLMRVNAPGSNPTWAAAAVLVVLLLPIAGIADEGGDDAWRINQVDTSRYPLVDLYATLPGDADPGHIRGMTLMEGEVEASIVEIRDLSTGVRDAPLTVSLVLDVSESMRGEKLREARRAMERFSDTVPSGSKVNLVVFSDTVRVMASGISPEKVSDRTKALSAEGHTALFDAVQKGVRMLQGVPGRRVVLTLTDGKANRGTTTMEDAMREAEEAGISLLFVGLGPDARRNRLDTMALRTGGRSVYTTTPAALSGLFEGMAEEITSEVLFRYRASNRDMQVVPVTLRLTTRTSQVEVGSRYFSPRATFMGTTGKGSLPLVLLGLLGPVCLLGLGRLTSYNISQDPVLLVEGSSQATRMLTRVLTRHGMTVPMSIGGETLLVNNRPVTGTRTLKPGETLTWGETTILFRDK